MTRQSLIDAFELRIHDPALPAVHISRMYEELTPTEIAGWFFYCQQFRKDGSDPFGIFKFPAGKVEKVLEAHEIMRGVFVEEEK